jgi:hypothetical protein
MIVSVRIRLVDQEVKMDRIAILACLVLGAMAFVVAEPLEAG